MSKQKQSRVDLLEKKVKAITWVLQDIKQEMNNIRDLSIGTTETLKLMDGYDKAIESLKDILTEDIDNESLKFKVDNK